MRRLPLPEAARCVLSFDFDGTLHHPDDEPPVPPEFFEEIRRLRDERGAVWGINTGRSLPQLIEGFVESRFPFLPDWVVAREREIHLPNDHGRWVPHNTWNKRCAKEMRRMFRRSRHYLRAARREIEQHTGAEWIEMLCEPAGVIARSGEEMDWIVKRLVEMEPPESFGWQRNSIYLRFGHSGYQKGSALCEVAALYGLDASFCFAVGDGHNDLEMLDPRHAGFIACPANAVPEVLAKVRAHGGHVSRKPHAAGVLDALAAFFDAPPPASAR